MTFTETRYFVVGECPKQPGVYHLAAVIVSSSQPITMISPTIRPEDTEWHWCDAS